MLIKRKRGRSRQSSVSVIENDNNEEPNTGTNDYVSNSGGEIRAVRARNSRKSTLKVGDESERDKLEEEGEVISRGKQCISRQNEDKTQSEADNICFLNTKGSVDETQSKRRFSFNQGKQVEQNLKKPDRKRGGCRRTRSTHDVNTEDHNLVESSKIITVNNANNDVGIERNESQIDIKMRPDRNVGVSLEKTKPKRGRPRKTQSLQSEVTTKERIGDVNKVIEIERPLNEDNVSKAENRTSIINEFKQNATKIHGSLSNLNDSTLNDKDEFITLEKVEKEPKPKRKSRPKRAQLLQNDSITITGKDCDIEEIKIINKSNIEKTSEPESFDGTDNRPKNDNSLVNNADVKIANKGDKSNRNEIDSIKKEKDNTCEPKDLSIIQESVEKPKQKRGRPKKAQSLPNFTTSIAKSDCFGENNKIIKDVSKVEISGTTESAFEGEVLLKLPQDLEKLKPKKGRPRRVHAQVNKSDSKEDKDENGSFNEAIDSNIGNALNFEETNRLDHHTQVKEQLEHKNESLENHSLVNDIKESAEFKNKDKTTAIGSIKMNSNYEDEPSFILESVEKPKRKKGRPKKLKSPQKETISIAKEDCEEEEQKVGEDVSTFEIIRESELPQVLEKPKAKRGRPRKDNSQSNKTEFIKQNEDEKHDKVEMESINDDNRLSKDQIRDLIQEKPKRGRPRKAKSLVMSVIKDETSDEECSPNPSHNKTLPIYAEEEDSEEEINPQNSKKRKRIHNDSEDSEEEKRLAKSCRNQRRRRRSKKNQDENSSLCEEQRNPGRARKYVYRYSTQPDVNLSQINYLQRIDHMTKLSNRDEQVTCGVCLETMRVQDYQKEHMPKHNFLCWLSGEEPLDLENEILIERILARVKLHFPKIVFKCPRCFDERKSGRGFVSHRQFCGKTEKEKMSLMIACEICGRVMMPSSMDTHIYLNHENSEKKDEVPVELNKARKAAERCLNTIGMMNKCDTDNSNGQRSLNIELDSDDDLSEFFSVVTYNQKEYLDNWKKVTEKGEQVCCPCLDCDFKVDNWKSMKVHFKMCSEEAQHFKCSECNYVIKEEAAMLCHIRKIHYVSVAIAKQREETMKSELFKNGLPFIPFVKCAENLFKYPKALTKFFLPAMEWTKQQRSLHYANEQLYPQFNVQLEQWNFKSVSECKGYIQSTELSMRVKCDNSSWFQLKNFEAKCIKDNLALLYCGGPVFGLGWVPGSNLQYLAIAAHLSMQNFYQVSSTCSGPGNIQIWSMGNLNNKEDSTFKGMKLEYVICHNEGGCWGLEWCASGCFDDNRLGLLALATSSGAIPIYSVPLPNRSENESSLPICTPQPVLRLELGINENYQCTRISWSKIKPHRILAAGFVNGLIAVWDLLSESPLLKRGKSLYPFKIFQAHHSIISGLCFSPVSDNYIVSCAYDKTIKFWDLNDTTAPHSKQRRSLATDLTWIQHWMTCAAAIDSVYSTGETSITMNCIRDFIYEPQTLLTGVDSATLSISSNDWLNCVASSYDNGQVNLTFGCKQPIPSYDDRRKYVKVLFEPNLYHFGKQEYEQKSKELNKDCDITDCNSYDEAVDKYGIDFKTDLSIGMRETLKGNAGNPIEIYPLIAANKVCWNTNINGFLSLAVGYQSGFVLVPKLTMVPNDQIQVDNIY